MPIVKFNAKATKESASKVLVDTSSFKLVIDTPEGFGGTNQGASPTEYFLAALSGCLNVTAHTVANDMGIEIGSLEINLEGDLDPSKYIGATTEGRTGYQEIRVAMKADTNADEETLAKWFSAVQDRSAVFDNIINPTPIKISLV